MGKGCSPFLYLWVTPASQVISHYSHLLTFLHTHESPRSSFTFLSSSAPLPSIAFLQCFLCIITASYHDCPCNTFHCKQQYLILTKSYFSLRIQNRVNTPALGETALFTRMNTTQELTHNTRCPFSSIKFHSLQRLSNVSLAPDTFIYFYHDHIMTHILPFLFRKNHSPTHVFILNPHSESQILYSRNSSHTSLQLHKKHTQNIKSSSHSEYSHHLKTKTKKTTTRSGLEIQGAE